MPHRKYGNSKDCKRNHRTDKSRGVSALPGTPYSCLERTFTAFGTGKGHARRETMQHHELASRSRGVGQLSQSQVSTLPRPSSPCSAAWTLFDTMQARRRRALLPRVPPDMPALVRTTSRPPLLQDIGAPDAQGHAETGTCKRIQTGPRERPCSQPCRGEASWWTAAMSSLTPFTTNGPRHGWLKDGAPDRHHRQRLAKPVLGWRLHGASPVPACSLCALSEESSPQCAMSGLCCNALSYLPRSRTTTEQGRRSRRRAHSPSSAVTCAAQPAGCQWKNTAVKESPRSASTRPCGCVLS